MQRQHRRDPIPQARVDRARVMVERGRRDPPGSGSPRAHSTPNRNAFRPRPPRSRHHPGSGAGSTDRKRSPITGAGDIWGADPPTWSSDTLAKKHRDLGAPLRNRTVDLLLTICNFSGSSSAPNPGKAPCSRQQTPDRARYMAPPGPGRRLPRPWRPGSICDTRCRRATFRATVERRSDDLGACPSRAGATVLSSHLS